MLFGLAEERLRRVSVFGAGLLVGTALAVIVPEGVHTLIRGSGEDVDRAIGVSLVLGFLFMLLIDQLAASKNADNGDIESDVEDSSKASTSTWTTTLGLVVHAAADGIALGAAATTAQTDVEIIVFLAIMLHKAPAAFGLSSFLLHEGLDRNRVRRHLLMFALSAPIAAVATFVLLIFCGNGIGSTLHATGIAMLFSAGTFLYVATVHVLPEVGHQHHHHQQQQQQRAKNRRSASSGSSSSKCDSLLLVVGALMPLLLTMGHHH